MIFRMREESAPPENELQKFNEKTPNVSEHELRFRKSTEKLHVPDWYRERQIGHNGGDRERRTLLGGTSFDPLSPLPYNGIRTTTQHETSDTRYTKPFSYEQQDRYNVPPQVIPIPRASSGRNSAAIIPYGMFDKYKDEIEEMRKSRTSLNQIGTTDDRKVCLV